MAPADRTRASRWLAWALRHAPAEAGIAIDGDGFADAGEVVAAMRRAGHRIDEDGLAGLVAADPKGRYELAAGRVRAVHGHSVEVDLGLPPAAPPPVLWHGTVERAVPAVLAEGLTPRARRYVHLSTDPATAREVGARRGRPVVLRVDAAGMAAAGHRFWRPAATVWLAERVPPEFLTGPG